MNCACTKDAGCKRSSISFGGVLFRLLDGGVSPAVVAGILEKYVGFLSASSVGGGAASGVDPGGILAFAVGCENARRADADGVSSGDVVLAIDGGHGQFAECLGVGKGVGSCGVSGVVEASASELGGSDRGGHASGRAGAFAGAVGHGDSVQFDGFRPVEEKLGFTPGRWAESNRRKKEAKKRKAQRPGGFQGGQCRTVLSDSSSSACPSYGQALSDAEKEAKDSYAKRRVAENAVAEKLARMKLASLEDEKKCQEYADLKHHRVIQWTNEAVAKSQQSLDKCKSIDPGSSASQYEIRKQAKENQDLREEVKKMSCFIRDRFDDWQDLLASCKPASDSIDTDMFDGMCDDAAREAAFLREFSYD